MSSNPEGWAIALRRIAHEAEARTGALDLGMLGLAELPKELFALAHLRELNFGYLGRDELKARRKSGAQFSDNKLKWVLEKLTVFGQLRKLSVSGTDIVDLAWAQQLTGLESLDCSFTQVSDLAPLNGLTALQSLDCSDTQVRDLAPLIGLAKLEELRCSGLTLATLPEWFLRAPAIRDLEFHETRVPGVPVEVLSSELGGNCLEKLRTHFLDQQEGAEPVVEVKLMVLGNGRVGKTQFCRRLAGQEFEPDSDSTHGVAIVPARLPAGDGAAEIQLQMWDFGGQDIYQFITARMRYSCETTPFSPCCGRKTSSAARTMRATLIFGNQPLFYWVDYVRHLGGRDRAVTIVQTRCDRPGDEDICPVPETVIKEAFGRYGLVNFSSAKDRGRANLIEKLAESVGYLRERQGVATIGVARHRVKTKLEAMRAADAELPVGQRRHRTLTQSEFRKICKEAKLKSEPEFLLDYLVWREYARRDQELFLDMMRSCDVCFVHRQADAKGGVEAEFIAPELLPPRKEIEREIAAQWDADTPIETQEYVYQFLHQGLIRAIIAEIGAEGGVSALYWRDGVCAYEETTRARALIEQRMDEGCWSGRIIVQSRGGHAQELLAGSVR